MNKNILYLLFFLPVSLFSQTLIKENIALHGVKYIKVVSCEGEAIFKDEYFYNKKGKYKIIRKERDGKLIEKYTFGYKDSLLIKVNAKSATGKGGFIKGYKSFDYDDKGRLLRSEFNPGNGILVSSNYEYPNDSTEINYVTIREGDEFGMEKIETVRSSCRQVVYQRTFENNVVTAKRSEETFIQLGMEKRITKQDDKITRKYKKFLDDKGNPVRIEDDFVSGISRKKLKFNEKGLPVKEEDIIQMRIDGSETHRCLLYEYEYF